MVRSFNKYNMDKFIEKECKHHGLTTYILEEYRGKYRCRKCRVMNVTDRRKRLKIDLVKHLGGKCQVCGYNALLDALEFHHPHSNKEYNISEKSKSLKTMKIEAEKCILVCCRCHREIHAGFIECPELLFLSTHKVCDQAVNLRESGSIPEKGAILEVWPSLVYGVSLEN